MSNLTNLSPLVGGLIALAVIAFFIVRQFSTRRVTSAFNLLVPLALLYFGIQSIGQIADTLGWMLLAAGIGLGLGLGVVRGMTFRIWTGPRGEALMRGTSLTLLVWIATFGVRIVESMIEAHLGYGFQSGANAESLIPGAATVGAQVLVTYLRAQDQKQLVPA